MITIDSACRIAMAHPEALLPCPFFGDEGPRRRVSRESGSSRRGARTEAKSWHIELPREAFVALQYELIDRGLLAVDR